MTAIKSPPPIVSAANPGLQSPQSPAPDAGKGAFPTRDLPSLGTEATRDKAVELVEAHLKATEGINKKLTLELDQEAGVVVYKAIDRRTGEVIKQFPSEEMLRILAAYNQAEGLNIDGRV